MARTKISRFYITINTNVVDEDMINLLKESFDDFYDELEKFIVYRDRDGGFDDLISSKVESAVEIGPKLQRVHLHALLTIKHRTKIHLNYDGMRKFFSHELDMPIYFHVKAVLDPISSIREYISKNPASEKNGLREKKY